MNISNGKVFEELILNRARIEERQRLYTLGRYGVSGVFHEGEWRPITSLPDFEGVTPDGHQFIFDAKVCSQASYPLSGGTSRSFKRQYKHMQRRARFGASCGLLLHFNPRQLKTRTEPYLTVLFPISDGLFWQGYDAATVKRISRNDAQFIGEVVPWTTASSRTKILTPDIWTAIKALRARKDDGQ